MSKRILSILILIILAGLCSPVMSIQAGTVNVLGDTSNSTVSPTSPQSVQSTPESSTTTPAAKYNFLAPLPCPKGTEGCDANGTLSSFDPTSDANGKNTQLGKYLNLMITIVIGLAAVMAVVMIVIGGIEYMTTELISSKEAGKEKITGALLGLLLALGSYAILNTINPALLKSNLDVEQAVVVINLMDEQETVADAIPGDSGPVPSITLPALPGAVPITIPSVPFPGPIPSPIPISPSAPNPNLPGTTPINFSPAPSPSLPGSVPITIPSITLNPLPIYSPAPKATASVKVISPCPSGIQRIPSASIDACGSIAQGLNNMIVAAKNANINLSGGGYRPPSTQTALRIKNCAGDTTNRNAKCVPPTALPGLSRHNYGLAFDLKCNGALIQSQNNECFKWLKANASKYGLANYPVEPWHWSVDGR